MPSEEQRQVAEALWAYQNQLRHALGGSALKASKLPGGPLDPICLLLAEYTPAECRRALDVFAAEAEARRAVGQVPLEFLNGRTNWQRPQFERALASTPADMGQAVRSRPGHRKRGQNREPVLEALDRRRAAGEEL